jgi:hypothetical protein
MKQVFVFGVIVFIIISCTSNNKKQSANIPPVQKTEKSLSITSIGGVEFVRSFSEIMSLRSQKKIDKFMREREKSNPGFMHESYRKDTIDIFLKKQFERLGFVKVNELLLAKFNYSSTPDTTTKSFSGKEIKFHFERDTISGRNDKIITFYGKDSSHTRATFYFKIEYVLLDVIAGGNKELIVLTEHYMANTEFYYFEVFEIKTKD